jgi:hypothetical protein
MPNMKTAAIAVALALGLSLSGVRKMLMTDPV